MKYLILFLLAVGIYAQTPVWNYVAVDSASQYSGEIVLYPNQRIIAVKVDTFFVDTSDTEIDTLSFQVWTPTNTTYSAGDYQPLYYEATGVQIAIAQNRIVALDPDKFMGIKRLKIKLGSIASKRLSKDSFILYYLTRSY